MIALEAKSGRGLLSGGGRSRPNQSSLLATGARVVMRARVGQLEGRQRNQWHRSNRINDTVGKLERMRKYPTRKHRVAASYMLAGGGGAWSKQRQATQRLNRTTRKLDGARRTLRHFGG